MVDAEKRASAHRVIAVIPYFGWARQDRKDRTRVSIGAKLVANLLRTAWMDRVMTMDLHADQIQGFFNVPVGHLFASGCFVPYIKTLKLPDLSVVAPDMMFEMGAASVCAAVTHPLLSGPAYDRINASKLTEVIVINTIPP